MANVLREGEVIGVHYWNRLPGGIELDLTGGQFVAGETLDGARDVVRPPGLPPHGFEPYLLRRRVDALLT